MRSVESTTLRRFIDCENAQRDAEYFDEMSPDRVAHAVLKAAATPDAT
jgi:hypothetical protein